jgi:hypothetical protein
MTHPALDWLRQMNGAISVRFLYPPEHPRAVAVVQALDAATLRLTADRADVSLFVVEGRLACDGELVAGSDGMAARTFDALHAHGYDRITIRRGASREELAQLVGGSSPGRARRALTATVNIRFSVLDATTREAVERGPAEQSLMAAVELPELWRQVDEGRTLNVDALEHILAPLVTVVSTGAHGALTLASLRNHDEYTATHVTNVAVLTMALAQAVGLPPGGVRQVASPPCCTTSAR